MKTSLRAPVSLSITPQEAEILDYLKAKGIKAIMVFRRGLEAYKQECVEDLSQNNNA